MLLVDCLKSIAASAGAFAAARRNLIEQDKARGGDGRLRDCEASLGDDLKTILLFCNYGDDSRTLCAPCSSCRSRCARRILTRNIIAI
jgi:hypothetical protein